MDHLIFINIYYSHFYFDSRISEVEEGSWPPLGQELRDRSLDRTRASAVSISPRFRLMPIAEVSKVITTDPPETLKLEADSTNFIFAKPISVHDFERVRSIC